MDSHSRSVMKFAKKHEAKSEAMKKVKTNVNFTRHRVGDEIHTKKMTKDAKRNVVGAEIGIKGEDNVLDLKNKKGKFQ